MLKKITNHIFINFMSKRDQLETDLKRAFFIRKKLLNEFSKEIYKIQLLIKNNPDKKELSDKIYKFEKRFNYEKNSLKEWYPTKNIQTLVPSIAKSFHYFEESLEYIRKFIRASKWESGKDIKSFLVYNEELLLKRQSGAITQGEYERALDEIEIVENPLDSGETISCVAKQFNELKDNFINEGQKTVKFIQKKQLIG